MSKGQDKRKEVKKKKKEV